MFENKIRETSFTSSIADCMFRRINGNAYDGDVSFLATIRALLMNRVTSDDEVRFAIQEYSASSNEIHGVIDCLSCVSKTFSVLNLKTDITKEESEFTEALNSIVCPNGFHELEDVRIFFAEKMQCRAFINEELKSVIFVVLHLTIRKYHLMQCIIPKLMPWFFADNKISVKERELLLSLREKRSAQYEQTLVDISSTDAFTTKRTGAAVTAFKRKSLENKKRTSERSINQINHEIESLNNSLVQAFRNLSNENMRLSGIEIAMRSEIDSSDDELMQFLNSNHNIEVVECENSCMRIVVKGYLDIYDPESYRSISRNAGSWYWGPVNSSNREFNSQLARKRLLDAIFGMNPTYKIKTVGIYDINVDYEEVSAGPSRAYANYISSYYPNPHLYHNRCLGMHRGPINRCISRGDIVGAISQCISSAHSVNVTESASFRYVCTELFSSTNDPILEDMNGNALTPMQAYRQLTEATQNNAE